MLSFSDNELVVIGFLTRNFSERLTIRSIAQKLGFSAAGVFNILKKLEKSGIVTGQKLGTGLFYSMNFGSRLALHAASLTLIYTEEKIDRTILDAALKHKVAIFDKKTLLLMNENSISEISIPGVNVIVKNESELQELMRSRNAEILQVFRKGTVIHGEGMVVELIKNSISRF